MKIKISKYLDIETAYDVDGSFSCVYITQRDEEEENFIIVEPEELNKLIQALQKVKKDELK